MTSRSKEVPATKPSPTDSGGGKEFKSALDWEASRVGLMAASERRAWRAFFIALIALVLSWVAIVLMMPLKQTVPYVIRVDNSTGMTDIVTTLNSKEVEFDEVMDKYWIARYIRAREGYDWYTLQDDYNTVGLLSDAQVGKTYAAQFGGDTGIDTLNSDRVRTTVEIISVVPSDNGTATVRYRTKTGGTQAGSIPTVSNWVSTVAYTYKKPSNMQESMRLVNPFGFQVRSFRKDPEIVGGGS